MNAGPAVSPATTEEVVKKAKLAILLLVAAFCSNLFADQIVLKNGDRMTGAIVKSDGKTLVITTEYAGEVTVQWAAVQEVSSSTPLHVALRNGQTLVGPVSTVNGKLEVGTPANAVAAPKDEVVLMRNEAEQTAYEKSLRPGLREGWAGGANVGFALTRGNSQSKNLAVAFNASRKTLHDKIALYATSVYATNDAAGAVPKTTANAEQGGIRYDRDLKPRVFGFASADFQADSLQTLDLRSALGGGLGFHAIKRAATTLDLLAGGNYTHEKYDAFSRNFAAAIVGEDFLHKVHASTVFTQSLYFFPNLSDAGQYRGVLTLGTVTRISKRFGWQNSLGDIYVSNPPLGKKKNDVISTTGVNISFTH